MPPTNPPPQSAPSRRLTVAQAATYSGLTRRSIQRLIADGKLVAYRIGPRTTRIEFSDLDEMLSRRATNS